MPIFEFACQDCGHSFETLVRSGTVPECPNCHSTDLVKQLSVFATAAGTHAVGHTMTAAGPCGSCGHPAGPGACALQ